MEDGTSVGFLLLVLGCHGEIPPGRSLKLFSRLLCGQRRVASPGGPFDPAATRCPVRWNPETVTVKVTLSGRAEVTYAWTHTHTWALYHYLLRSSELAEISLALLPPSLESRKPNMERVYIWYTNRPLHCHA